MLRNIKTKIKKQKERITARNQLENYIFSVKQSIGDSDDELSTQDKDDVSKACEELLKWLDQNLLAEKEEYEDKMKELKKICTPIMTKLHGGAHNESNGQNKSQNTSGGPTIEEVY